jgi:hypothetical protein
MENFMHFKILLWVLLQLFQYLDYVAPMPFLKSIILSVKITEANALYRIFLDLKICARRLLAIKETYKILIMLMILFYHKNNQYNKAK